MWPQCWFYTFKYPCTSPLPTWEEVAHTHAFELYHTVKIESQRERERCRRFTDAGWPAGLQQPPSWWNNSDEFGSLWLFDNKKLSSKYGVAWSGRLRMTYGSESCDWKRGWRLLKSGRRGIAGVCSIQTLLKQVMDPGDSPGHCCLWWFLIQIILFTN